MPLPAWRTVAVLALAVAAGAGAGLALRRPPGPRPRAIRAPSPQEAAAVLSLLAPSAAPDAPPPARRVPPFVAPAALPPWQAALVSALKVTSSGASLEVTAVAPGWAWAHGEGVTGVAALADGAVSVDSGGHVLRWAADGRCVWSRALRAGAWFEVATDAAGAALVIAGGDGVLRRIDAATGADAWASAPGPPMKHVVLDDAGARAVTVDERGEVALWDLRAGARRVLQAAGGGEARFTCAAISGDGHVVAAGSLGGEVRTWRVDAPGDEPRAWPAHDPLIPERNEDGARAVALDRTGDRLLTGGGWPDGRVRLWDARDGRLVGERRVHEHIVHVLRFSPDGATAASGSSDGTLVSWDVTPASEGPRERRRLVGHGMRVLALGFSPDGRRIVSGSSDCRVLEWDVATGELDPRRRRSVRALARAPGEEQVVYSVGSDGRVERRDLATGDARVVLAIDGEQPHALAVAPDGAVVVGTTRGAWLGPAGAERPVKLEGADETFAVAVLADGGAPERARAGLAGGTEARPPDDASPPEAGERSRRTHHADWHALTVGRRALVRRWGPDGAGEQPLFGIQSSGEGIVFGLNLTPDGRRAVFATVPQLQVWRRAGDGWTFERGLTPGGYALALAPDARRALAASTDRTTLLDLERQDDARHADLPGAATRPVAFAPGGRLAVTGTAAGGALVWDLGREPVRLAHLDLAGTFDRPLCAEFLSDDVLLLGTQRGALLRLRVTLDPR